MSADFDMSEVARLAADIDKAAARIKPDAERKVLDPAARETVAEASRRSPRLTGALAASWYSKREGDARIVTSDVRQAFYQEFGTSVMAPQPSLFPAADKAGDQMTRRLDDIADPLR